MNRLAHKKNLAGRRSNRVRSTIHGTSERPRLSVHVSLMHVSAQVIDDDKKATIAAISTAGKKIDGNLSAKAEWAGAEIAKKATAAKVKKVVLDRGPKLYHGRVKAFADAARKNGLEF